MVSHFFFILLIVGISFAGIKIYCIYSQPQLRLIKIRNFLTDDKKPDRIAIPTAQGSYSSHVRVMQYSNQIWVLFHENKECTISLKRYDYEGHAKLKISPNDPEEKDENFSNILRETKEITK